MVDEVSTVLVERPRRVDVARLAQRAHSVAAPSDSETLSPLVKSAGGKGWLGKDYAHLLPEVLPGHALVSLFVGGGAVEAHYVGRVACRLNDKNKKLMAVYQAVLEAPDALVARLRQFVYEQDLYYATRKQFNDAWHDADLVTRAAWYVYLNKTCYNGLFRENRRGGFNVPFGRYTNPLICDEPSIHAWSRALRRSQALLREIDPGASMLTALDFEGPAASARAGDYVFCDPVYLPVDYVFEGEAEGEAPEVTHEGDPSDDEADVDEDEESSSKKARKKTKSFTSYQADGFSIEDQRRLTALLPRLDAAGAHFLLTNAGSSRPLYPGWYVLEAMVARAINAKAKARGAVPEILVSNRPLTPPPPKPLPPPKAARRARARAT